MIIIPRRRTTQYLSYVQDYINRVIAADVTAGNTLGLEIGVTDAISNCLQSLVAAGFLGVSDGVITQAASVFKTGGLMAGARTLAGSLIPYASTMPLPTVVNFVSGDYNRKTGTIGNASNKYIDLNFNNNLVGQNSHQTVYVTSAGTQVGFQPYIAGGANVTGTSLIMQNSNTALIIRNRNSSGTSIGGAAAVTATGFIGHSRNSSANITYRINGVSTTIAQTAETAANSPTLLFARSNSGAPTGGNYSAARIAAWSVGGNVDDQAAYESILVTYMNAIASAIPS